MNRARLIQTLRTGGLLKPIDAGRLLARRWSTRAAKQRSIHQHRDFAIPPSDLMFDALAHVDLWGYRASGMEHAAGIARVIDAAYPEGPLEVLEWGCGPGRLIRHMPALLGSHPAVVVDSDYNPRTIASHRGGPGAETLTAT